MRLLFTIVKKRHMKQKWHGNLNSITYAYRSLCTTCAVSLACVPGLPLLFVTRNCRVDVPDTIQACYCIAIFNMQGGAASQEDLCAL